MENLIFTNTTLLRIYRCEKSFYLNLRYPELKEEVGESKYSVLERRKIVAKLMKHLFPNGKYAGIDITGSCELSNLRTKELLSSSSQTIFNACLKHEELYCFADVLHKENGRWSTFGIWEDKDKRSSIYLTATYQRYIMQQNGINAGSYYSIVYHPNRENKDRIDLSYVLITLDDQIKYLHNNLILLLEKARRIVKQGKIPEVRQGKHCTYPQNCEFINYCKFSDKK